MWELLHGKTNSGNEVECSGHEVIAGPLQTPHCSVLGEWLKAVCPARKYAWKGFRGMTLYLSEDGGDNPLAVP